ncbi:hypothetical protein FGADI_12003 [Fusarium gaditjirri]|uniref:Leptomycin B resistance protein pmd1 n=1 Tax=Fusarium gaditjirri TaxID=282569 RepID=A0A8H4WPS5_9HYPO|nr:hypothetical protein FGADI_12003 [Fusarium gaditjirri]
MAVTIDQSGTEKPKRSFLSSLKTCFIYLELLFAAGPTWVDYLLIALGTLCAVGAGVPFPLMGVLFGQLIDNFNGATCAADGSASGASEAASDPLDYENAINDKVIKTAWIGAIALVLIYGHLTCWNIISQRLAQRLRTRYVSALLRQPPEFFDTRGASGQVSSRLQGDITAVQAGTSEKVGNIITTMSFFVTVFVIAFTKQPRLAGILICMLPAFLLSGILGGRYLSKFVVKQTEASAAASSIASEALSHVAVVQAFGAAPRLEEKFAEHMARSRKYAIAKSSIAAIQTGMLYFIAYSGNALAFWRGSKKIAESVARNDGSTTVGEIYAIVYLLVDACVMLGGMAPTLPFLGAAVGAFQRLKEDIDAPSSIDGTSREGVVLSPSAAKTLTFRNVSFEYASRRGQPVLENVNLDFPAGTYTAIVGLSGSGKSTIASLIARLHDPTKGTVELEGHDLQDLNVKSLRSFISFVQQEPSLLDRSILENIALGLVNSPNESHQHLKPLLKGPELAKMAAKGKDALDSAASLGPEFVEIANLIRHATEQADAASFIERLELGYGTTVGPKGSLLSGGQRQRIALARALIRDPEILVLDEATAALDSASEKRIQLAVERAAAEKRTIISIAHRLSTIRNADNIVVMKAGRVVEQGAYDDLMAKEDGEFAHMAKLQTVGNKSESGSLDGESIGASTLRNDTQLNEKSEVSRAKQSLGSHILGREKEETKNEEMASEDHELDDVKPFSSVIKGLVWLIRPSLGWFTLAMIAAVFVGATFSGSGIIFGFTVGALNPCANTLDHIRSMGNMFAGLFFMLAGVELIANFLAWLGFGIVAERLLYNLRVLSFRSLLEQGIHWHQSEGRTPTSLLGIITKDSMSVGAFSGSTFGTVFAILINVLIAVIISHIFAWKIALVCLVTLPILLGSGFMQLRMLARYEERHREAFSTATALATEAIQSIRTVAVLSLENEYMEGFARLLKPPREQVVRASVTTNIWLAISYTTGTFINALAYWWGSQLIMKGEYTQKDFLIILVAMLTSAQLWSGMFSLAPEFSRARLALSRVMTVVNMGSSTHTGKPGQDPSKTGRDIEASGGEKSLSPAGNHSRGGAKVTFKGVSFAYPSRPDATILDNVSFALSPNQFCGLVGPSGAGKSTIMNLVQRLYEPTSGSVLIDDNDISKLPASFRDTIALVPQDPALFDGSVRFNVGLGAPPGHEVTDDEIEEACRLANIHDVIAALPDGYDTECGPSASRLSGGQRQRLAIARALVRRPRLLLLDESTSALDAASEAALQEGLERASRGTTVLAITHRLHTVQKADIIFIVENGQIIDNSQRLLCKVRIEEMRLVVWGRDWGVAEGRLEAHLESSRNHQLRSLALQILEELHSAATDFKKLKNRYGLVDERRASLEITGSKPRKSPSPSRKRSKDDESRDLNGASKVTSERNRGKEMGLRARWVIADKDKFINLLRDLLDFNDGLERLFPTSHLPSFQRAWTNQLLESAQRDVTQLSLLEIASDGVYPKLNTSANLKKLRINLDAKPQASFKPTFGLRIPRAALDLSGDGSDGGRNERVAHVRRHDDLARMMHSASDCHPDLHSIDCVGYVDDTPRCRYGLVYKAPSPSFSTLHELISSSDLKTLNLDDRVRLAHTLAVALWSLHSLDWLHKSLCSSNILFFPSSPSAFSASAHSSTAAGALVQDIQCPYLTGFDASRPDLDTALSVAPRNPSILTLHRHPASLRGFPHCKPMVIYSLGLVLLEIGLWKVLQTYHKPHYSMGRWRDKVLRAALVPSLGSKAGSRYREVVDKCLAVSEEMTSAEAGKVIEDVVTALEAIQA